MEIGAVIKKLRKRRNIGQVEFAKLCGISQTSLSLIEIGKTKPHHRTVEKIATSLGISVMFLYFSSLDEDDVPPERRAIFREKEPLLKFIILEILG